MDEIIPIHDYVNIKSGDGVEFTLPLKAACISPVLKKLLMKKVAERDRKPLEVFISPKEKPKTHIEIEIQDIPGYLLEKALKYCTYKFLYGNEKAETRPPFIVEPEESTDLLIVADFLKL
ncbi:putative multi-domain containing protein [Aduncisulcus paluster]|uniref:Elongin-C n=1 Tax=Aduncisulcus paluster TaxID=2918883 RepID=A0ABQ5KXF7_9EUKA|nr:putative multi-domain containing protein [Aduncisulcus paluster]